MDTLNGTAAANPPDYNNDPAKRGRDSSRDVEGGGTPGPAGVTAGDASNASGASVTRRAAAAAAEPGLELGPGSESRRVGDRVPAQRSPQFTARSTTLSPFAAMLGLDSRDKEETYVVSGSSRARSSSNDSSRSDSYRSHGDKSEDSSLQPPLPKASPPSTVPGAPPPPPRPAAVAESTAALAHTVASRKSSSSTAGSRRSGYVDGGDFTRSFVSVLAGEAKETESDADVSRGSGRTTARRRRSERQPATASGEVGAATPAVNMMSFRDMLGYLLGTATVSSVPTTGPDGGAAAAAGAGSGAGGNGSSVQHRGGLWDVAWSWMPGPGRRGERSRAEIPVVGTV